MLPTPIHADIFRALLNVKSLKSLSIDTLDKQLTVADFERLKDLTNLVHLNLPSGGAHGRSRVDQEKIDALITQAILAADQRKREQEKHNEPKARLKRQ
jgi:hypothetical protein